MRQAILVLCLMAMGCKGGDGESKQPGNDSGPSGNAVTLREVCEEVGTLTCDRLAECGESQGADCKQTFVMACCNEDSCDEEVLGEGELEECLDALHDLSCEEFLNGVVPAQCGG